MKNNTSTLYHKGKLRKFNSNSSKISLIKQGASILMYTHYMKKPKYTYTLIYINIHKLSFYSALSVNHIMHLNDVFEELLHCINSFDGRFVDI